MKKFVVLTLFGLLILASTASAQKLEFRASGMVDFNTVLNTNVPFYFGQVALAHAVHGGIFNTWGTPGFDPLTGTPTNSLNHTTAYAYSRGLLRFDAIMDKNLSGTIYFELDSFRWGGSPGWGRSGAANGVGQPGGILQQASDRNNFGVWSTDRASVEVKNVYFDVGLPYFGLPVPMTVRVGAQPFGVRPQIFMYTDGAGITGGIKAGPVTIIPMWAKLDEGLDFASDDADLYGLHMNAKLGTFTLGGYAMWFKMNTYPLSYASGSVLPGQGAGTAFPATSSSYGLLTAGTDKASMWWLGLYADGKAGPVNLNFDFVLDTGKAEQKLRQTAVIAPDVKYNGWAGRIKLDFPVEIFNFGLVGMYASGADANKTSKGGLPGDSVANRFYGYNPAYPASRRVNSYVVPPGSENAPAANESIVMYSCFNASADGGTGIANVGNYAQMSRGAYGGTAFLKGYASIKAMPWWKITLQGLYIWDTTKHGNTFGTAVKNPLAPYGSQILKNDTDIGFELDLVQELDIFKNLKGYIGLGYLWAGDALDVYNNAVLGASPFLGRNYSPKNPWNFTTRFIYSF